MYVAKLAFRKYILSTFRKFAIWYMHEILYETSHNAYR